MKKVDYYKFFYCINTRKNGYLLSNKQRKRLLNRAKEYYENNKEKLREPASNKYRELSNEETDEKQRIRKKRISKYV